MKRNTLLLVNLINETGARCLELASRNGYYCIDEKTPSGYITLISGLTLAGAHNYLKGFFDALCK